MKLLIAVTFLFAYCVKECLFLEFSQIEKIYEENQASDQIIIPKIDKQISLQNELQEYKLMHEKAQFKEFKADPQLSADILLKDEDGLRDQSIFVDGQKQSILLLDLSIMHKGDNFNHQKQSLNFYVIDQSNKQIIASMKVKHLRLIQLEIKKSLYEIKVGHDWIKRSEQSNLPSDQQIIKHISLKIQIIKKSGIDKEYSVLQKINKIKKQTDRIFLSSLDSWDEINRQQSVHFKNQEEVYFHAYIELLIISIFYVGEYLILRRILKTKSII